jgi:CubicO group peptidase (beta-lactamase class C family)
VRLACSNLEPPGVFTLLGDGFAAGMRVVRPESVRDADLPAGAVSWGGAAGTTMWVDRSNGFALVMMTQFMPQDAYPIWEEIRRAAYEDLAA